ncbi:MAG: sensor histidine kinase, partial [Clostridia bacterium]|nr:sensor histidine kinase [Clostridia bacterium]
QLLLLDDIDRDVAVLVLSIAAVFLAVDCILGVISVINLAIRIKSRTFLENTLIFRIWKPFSRILKKVLSFLSLLWKEVRLEPKAVIILASVAVFDFFLATFLSFNEFLAAILIEGVILSVLLVWYAAAIQLLHRDLTHRVEGKLEYRSDLSRLPPGLRSFGEDLNRSAEGMEKALEEKMKSERFKTELITGVSHDIKTPLTSIVNYVDLMKKEEVENEKIKEYLEVLDRQSARLKKLTEDLVESSKAASGSLPIDLDPMDVKVLMEQVQGEYQSALEEKGLTPVFNLPQDPVFILADGKRFWRVLDNLMNNITKYAMEGTRVYGDLILEKGVAKIIFRNISACPLPFSGEDLTEKFVRGDASRNTEGSGLGLAIAKSYVELQKGRFEVICDGDLFKVQISFDIIE